MVNVPWAKYGSVTPWNGIADVTLESLRCLCAIIETRSFRAAAERLHRSQPAIRQALKVLEREAGHPRID
ncbi:MAG: LysR family transcriptional regulator, partial [Verrucomicrobiales bacterium]